MNFLIFIFLLIIFNIWAYFLMVSDKRKAKLKVWRTPEKTLLIYGWLFGSFGIWLGTAAPLYHKTTKFPFRYGMLLAMILHVFLLFHFYHWGKLHLNFYWNMPF